MWCLLLSSGIFVFLAIDAFTWLNNIHVLYLFKISIFILWDFSIIFCCGDDYSSLSCCISSHHLELIVVPEFWSGFYFLVELKHIICCKNVCLFVSVNLKLMLLSNWISSLSCIVLKVKICLKLGVMFSFSLKVSAILWIIKIQSTILITSSGRWFIYNLVDMVVGRLVVDPEHH